MSHAALTQPIDCETLKAQNSRLREAVQSVTNHVRGRSHLSGVEQEPLLPAPVMDQLEQLIREGLIDDPAVSVIENDTSILDGVVEVNDDLGSTAEIMFDLEDYARRVAAA